MTVERQQVQVPPSAHEQPTTSRPLRTGNSFVLVVPSRRVVALRWDKVEYQPGEACRLSLLGRGLGKEPLSLAIESEGEGGIWTPVARLQAEVSGDETEARSSWTMPAKPVVAGAATLRETDGSELGDARFEDPRDLQRGTAVWMLARATGFEGRCLQVVLEREGEPGEWLLVGEAVATVRSGALRAAVDLNSSKQA